MITAWKTALCALFFMMVLVPGGGTAHADDPRDVYFELVTGSFTSGAQAKRDRRYDDVIWHIAEVPALRDDTVRWTYVEQWEAGSDAPYRQRLQSYRLSEDGSIIVRSYRLPDAAAYVEAWKSPDRFAGVDTRELTAAGGCDVVLARTGEKRFEGSTSGQQCKTTWRGAAFVISHSLVTEYRMVNWDRGFASDGAQVWGPGQGGYEFRRLSQKTVCASPVYMVVYGDIYDRAKFGAYARAIGESGLYPKTQGYYAAITPTLDVFEGEPGANHGMVLVEFPCLQAAKDFWFSDEYEAIKPLREGISDFTVTVVPSLPKPDYIRR